MEQSRKKSVQTRIRRISGQVRGIQKMVDEDRYCVDVLTQINAVRAALAKVSAMMLESHLNTCVTSAFNSDDPDEQAAKIAELVAVFDKGMK